MSPKCQTRSGSCRVPIIFAGTPATIILGGTSLLTNAPATIIEFVPILMLQIIVAFTPILQPEPIDTGPDAGTKVDLRASHCTPYPGCNHVKLSNVYISKISKVHIVPNRGISVDLDILFVTIDTFKAATDRHAFL